MSLCISLPLSLCVGVDACILVYASAQSNISHSLTPVLLSITVMRTKALINHFHELQPIYSAHFEPGSKGRLATAGGDNNVRVCFSLLLIER